jgi:integrase
MGLTGHAEDLGGDRWRLVVNLPPELRVDPATGETRSHYPRKSREVEARGVRRAREALDAFKAEIEARIFIDPEGLTVARLLELWLELDVAPGVRPKTAQRYRELARKHLIPRLGGVLAAQFKPADWLAFHKHCREAGRLDGGGGLSEQTTAHLFKVLHRAFEWRVESGALASNPLRRVGRRARPSPAPRRQTVWTTAQLFEALRLAEGSDLQVVAALAGLAGLRRGEICALRWRDLDREAGTLVVRHSIEQAATHNGEARTLHELPPKTAAGVRTVLLPALVFEVLDAHKVRQDAFKLAAGRGWNREGRVLCGVYGGALKPDPLSARWTRWVRRHKLTPHVTLHGLRHSYATSLYDLGVRTATVQARLGHSSPVITRTLYVHATAGADAAALELQEAAIAEQVKRESRDSVSELAAARSQKSCK